MRVILAASGVPFNEREDYARVFGLWERWRCPS
jgi:hypothetical protein